MLISSYNSRMSIDTENIEINGQLLSDFDFAKKNLLERLFYFIPLGNQLTASFNTILFPEINELYIYLKQDDSNDRDLHSFELDSNKLYSELKGLSEDVKKVKSLLDEIKKTSDDQFDQTLSNMLNKVDEQLNLLAEEIIKSRENKQFIISIFVISLAMVCLGEFSQALVGFQYDQGITTIWDFMTRTFGHNLAEFILGQFSDLGGPFVIVTGHYLYNAYPKKDIEVVNNLNISNFAQEASNRGLTFLVLSILSDLYNQTHIDLKDVVVFLVPWLAYFLWNSMYQKPESNQAKENFDK